MIVKPLTEHHLKFLSLKGGCTGSCLHMSKYHVVGNLMHWLDYVREIAQSRSNGISGDRCE